MDNDNSISPDASTNALHEQPGATEGTPVGVRVKTDEERAEEAALKPSDAPTAGAETAEALPEPEIVVEEASSHAPRKQKKEKGGLSGGAIAGIAAAVVVVALVIALIAKGRKK